MKRGQPIEGQPRLKLPHLDLTNPPKDFRKEHIEWVRKALPIHPKCLDAAKDKASWIIQVNFDYAAKMKRPDGKEWTIKKNERLNVTEIEWVEPMGLLFTLIDGGNWVYQIGPSGMVDGSYPFSAVLMPIQY